MGDFKRNKIVSYFVLINNSPSSFFQSFWGLRQGDPLSLCLFVIAMEALSCLLKRVKVGGFLLGWQVRGKGEEGVEVFHLLFADDTLLFYERSLD